MNRTMLVSLVTFLLSGVCFSQDFLVTLKGDTVSGEIKPLFYGHQKNVQVEENGKKKKIYSMLETRMYRLNNEYFYPIKGPHGYTFMKLLKQGYLSLYAFQYPEQHSFDGLMLVKLDGQSMEIPNLGFRRHLSEFLKDFMALSEQIDHGELTKKDLYMIIDKYNQYIEKQSSQAGPAQATTTTRTKTTEKNQWDLLEDRINELPDFDQKVTALEIITEIKGKLKRSEKIPAFMIGGLKEALSNQKEVQADLEEALEETPQ